MTRDVPADRPSPIAQAIEILRLSNDGNDLSALELKIVEMAVNSRLSDHGRATLAKLLGRLRGERR